MNRTELVDAIGSELDLTNEVVDQVLQEFARQVAEATAKGESVYVRNFGRWVPRHLKPARGVNPRTGLEWEAGERTTVRFVPGKMLKGEP